MLLLQFLLKINQLPQLSDDENYFCVFNNDSLSKATYSTINHLKCTLPNYFKPKIPNGQNYVNVSLSVRYSKKSVYFDNFVDESNFVYYDCSVHNYCKDCVKSQWQCVWCFYESKCTNNDTKCRQHPDDPNVSE